MTDIPIGIVGKILAGDEKGMYVKVIDDAESTGGFLILTGYDQEMKKGFDGWVGNRNALEGYFRESGWLIEWMIVQDYRSE